MEEICPFLAPPTDKGYPKWDEIEENLQLGSSKDKKLDALEKLIRYQVSGEQPPDTVIMTVIQNISQSKDHDVKRLLFLYYEILETRDRKGELKPEFILICDSISRDLTHVNEYIRSAALRFISRFQEKELIEKLVGFVVPSLKHNNAYVRRHAVVAIGRIHQKWPEIAPDAPQDIADLLRTEQDSSCRRVAFLVLCDISRDLAAEFLDEILENSALSLSQPMQLTAVSLIKSLCSEKRKSLYLPSLLELLDSPSTAVKIEAALTLLDLTSSPTASKASFSTLYNIIQTIPNSSLQLSIAEQIEKFIPTHRVVAQQLVGELIVAMKAKAIRSTVLKMIEQLAIQANVKDIIQGLISHLETEKEKSTKDNEAKDAISFMRGIIKTLHTIAATFPSTLPLIYDKVTSFVTNNDGVLSYESMMIIRDYAEAVPQKANEICIQLENLLPFIPNPRIIRSAAYLISLKTKRQESTIALIDAYEEREKSAQVLQNQNEVTTTTVIGQDGTYITEYTTNQAEASKPVWFTSSANIFVASTIATSLARICWRLKITNQSIIDKCKNYIAKILNYPTAATHEKRLSIAYLALCHCNEEKYKGLYTALVTAADEAYKEVIQTSNKQLAVKKVIVEQKNFTPVYQKLSFGSLLGRKFDSASIVHKPIDVKKDIIVQVTGNTDPIFAECYLTYGKFDIGLTFKFLNQTAVDLKNLRLELYCSGKLEIVDKPSSIHVFTPSQHEEFFYSVKVSSAEAGKVFGAFLYQVESITDDQLIPLSPITITPQHYMNPVPLDPATYRTKWEAFEWEKKMAIKTSLSIPDFIDSIAKVGCMYVMNEIDKSASFVTVNLCSTSAFNEETLLNISLENNNGKVEGYMRLRCADHSLALAYSRLLQSANN